MHRGFAIPMRRSVMHVRRSDASCDTADSRLCHENGGMAVARDKGSSMGARGLFCWRGVMSWSEPIIRRTGIAITCMLCIAMVATQFSYRVVGHAHAIIVLAPIASSALGYGPLTGCFVGPVAGLAELIHATLLPLDYYEKYFMAPWNSVVLFALVGLVLGVLFAVINRRHPKSGWRRYTGLVLCCMACSLLFTAYFQLSASIINSLLEREVPHGLVQQLIGSRESLAQWGLDSVLMSVFVLSMDAYLSVHNESMQRTIRETFQGWLAVVVALAYLTCAALAYTGISVICRGEAEQRMSGQLVYLADQLAERDRMLDAFARRTAATQNVLDEVHDSSIGGVARGYAMGDDGICAIAEDGVVVSSNVDAYIGEAFEDVVGSGFVDGFSETLFDATRSSEWDMGGGVLGYLRATQLGYVRVSRSGDYQLMVAISAAEMFRWRSLLMTVVSLAFLGVFVTVYMQASILLRDVVVRNIDRTNETLSRITDGELDEQVQVSDPMEFAELSSGINATVGSLKDAIAAEAARIDRDLATAKAIQESALPRTFPPFPEIEAFDIYASMTPAREVGGDFYDIFLVGEHTACFLVADVSGKGIPASLFMMAAKTEIANNVAVGMDLGVALQTANWHLCQGNEAGMFVTVWAALLDYQTGELTYVNAGHNPPLLRRGGSWEWLRQRGGLFLGAFDSAKYRTSTLMLKPGDELLLYTDGVNEAFDVTGEQYGEERLEAFLSNHANLHPHALVDALGADLSQWAEGAEQSDDITMLSIEYGVPPEATGGITVPAEVSRLDEVLDLVHAELAQRRCPITVQHQLDIVIEELFVNVCNYAYEGLEGPGDCRVEYVYNANPHALTVSLTDWGTPFDPLAREDPTMPTSAEDARIGGLGIFMVKRMCDDVSYLRDGDANVVAIRKVW